jgi:hypothetical protein
MPGFGPFFEKSFNPPLSYYFVAVVFVFWLIHSLSNWNVEKLVLLGLLLMALLSYIVNGLKLTNLLSSYLFFVISVYSIYGLLQSLPNVLLVKILRMVVFFAVVSAFIALFEKYSNEWHLFLRQLNNTSFYLKTNNVGGWISGNFKMIRVAGLCDEPGFFSSIQALSIPFCLYTAPDTIKKKIYYYLITLCPILLAMYWSFGRTGWLTVMAGSIMFFLVFNLKKADKVLRRIVYIVVLCMLVIFSPYYFNISESILTGGQNVDFSILQRVHSVNNGLDIVRNNLFFGVGPGGVASLGEMYGSLFLGWAPSILNMYINIGAEIGIFGMGLFFIFIFLLLSRSPGSVFIEGIDVGQLSLMATCFLSIIWLNLPDLRMSIMPFIVALALHVNKLTDIGKKLGLSDFPTDVYFERCGRELPPLSIGNVYSGEVDQPVSVSYYDLETFFKQNSFSTRFKNGIVDSAFWTEL